ncbi:DUF222 domain-containing protein [Conyzicola sp.]|uniref:HNH endonuclease signature motif containing protein n=1 Tax=Conyzicola sp. TaxID=1969404 RepID=UPI003988F901
MQTTTATDLTKQFAAAVTALSAVSKDVADFQTADDAALVELSRLAAQEKQIADAHLALIAGEIAARSTREMGQSGLAQREGFRSTEELLRTTTGATGRDATTAVRVGRLVREAATAGSIDPATGEQFEAREPWLADVAAAVSAGSLSVAAADAIRTGLGSPTDNVSADALAGAARELCLEAAILDVDRLLKRARELRDELDEVGIADRERERFEKRSLRHYVLSNGMGRLVWDLDPENYAVVTELYDRATSPKRGVRFVEGDRKEAADRILADPRTIEQLASDTLLGLLQAGADADSSQLLGTGAAAIRVLVTKKTVKAREGHGRIEGTSAPISLATVERLSCGGDLRDVTIDSFGQPLDVGKEQRFFTPKQRIALAVRDGGCLFGDCDRPPSMTEAHHIKFWARDDGRTDLKDGVLLCKFHHLLCHNKGWEIERVGTDYFLVPPPDIDPSQTYRPMPSKSPAMRDLRREQEAAR